MSVPYVSTWNPLLIKFVLTSASTKLCQQEQRIWACRFIALTYVVSGALSLFPLVSVGAYAPAKHGTSCTIDWSLATVTSRAYIVCLVLAGFLAPFLGTVLLYGRVTSILCNLKNAFVNPECAERWVILQRKTISVSVTANDIAVAIVKNKQRLMHNTFYISADVLGDMCVHDGLLDTLFHSVRLGDFRRFRQCAGVPGSDIGLSSKVVHRILRPRPSVVYKKVPSLV